MSANLLNVSDAAFEKHVLKSEIPVLVDFWAEWCGPCKMLSPVLEEIAKEFEGKLKIAKINIENELETPTKYAVRSIPTLLLFKNGEIVERQVGALGKSQLSALIKPHLEA
ncbi:thioredoxin [Acetobacteraceae bacterium]|nr:thioredoxin [Acetobacteraceae bacterium]